MKKLNKYKYIYLFIVVLSLIGFLSGYFYYNAQSNEMKDQIQNKINIEEELSTTTNNTFKRLKETSIYFICGLTIIPELINIFHIYYEPFTAGFIFNMLKPYSLKFSLFYTLIYHLIPLLFKLILLRLTMSLSYNLFKYIFKKSSKNKKKAILLSKKYLILTLFLLFYEFIIFIFNPSIHEFLMTFITN